MTDKKNAVSKLRFALILYQYQTKHTEELAAEGKMDMRLGFFLMAFKSASIITDNAFTREQFQHMIDNHLDELIRMTYSREA